MLLQGQVQTQKDGACSPAPHQHPAAPERLLPGPGHTHVICILDLVMVKEKHFITLLLSSLRVSAREMSTPVKSFTIVPKSGKCLSQQTPLGVCPCHSLQSGAIFATLSHLLFWLSSLSQHVQNAGTSVLGRVWSSDLLPAKHTPPLTSTGIGADL